MSIKHRDGAPAPAELLPTRASEPTPTRSSQRSCPDYPCEVMNISAGGMTLLSPVGCEVGERIVAYLDHFGRIEAVVSRPVDGGFAAEIVASLH